LSPLGTFAQSEHTLLSPGFIHDSEHLPMLGDGATHAEQVGAPTKVLRRHRCVC